MGDKIKKWFEQLVNTIGGIVAFLAAVGLLILQIEDIIPPQKRPILALVLSTLIIVGFVSFVWSTYDVAKKCGIFMRFGVILL